MKRLTVLCATISATGHINATLGIAFALRNRGHRVVFITEKSYKGFFERQGFEEQIFNEREHTDEAENGKIWTEWIRKNLQYVGNTAIEGYPIIVNAYSDMIDYAIYSNRRVEEIVSQVKPDVIIEDRMFVPMPAFILSGIPIIKICSVNPLYALSDESLPPGFFGLPTVDKSKYEICRQILRDQNRENVIRVNKWFKDLDKKSNNNLPVIFRNNEYREYQSTNLNILIYPEALMEDYLKSYSLPSEYIRLDHSIRESNESFELPEKLKKREGKIIYFSLGSVAVSMTDLIEKFIHIFAKTEYRVIASLGQLSAKYELPENVWGAPYVPQLKVLPHVDLVLTHGGNNTFIESLYHAKPIIVFPLFADQFDNAKRVEEMKIGRTFNALNFECEELLAAIDSLIEDNEAKTKLKEISKQLRNSNSMDKLIDRIEFVAQNPIFPSIR